ncbi:MAG TPA: MFS transporter [Pseudonocardiaceae bacterium]|jgi:MFS family permease
MTYCTQDRTAVIGHRVHRAWWVAAVSGLAIICAGTVTTTAGLLVDPLHREFGWSRTTIGIAVLVNMALYGLTGPFGAALMDRFGIRRVIACALTAVAAGSALTTVMTGAWQLVLCWGVLVGAGAGCMATAFAATVTNRWFAARRGLVTGMPTEAGVFGQFVFLPLLSCAIAASLALMIRVPGGAGVHPGRWASPHRGARGQIVS